MIQRDEPVDSLYSRSIWLFGMIHRRTLIAFLPNSHILLEYKESTGSSL